MPSFKSKRVYSSVKLATCPRCKCQTKHSLIDADKGIYKCIICKTVHA